VAKFLDQHVGVHKQLQLFSNSAFVHCRYALVCSDLSVRMRSASLQFSSAYICGPLGITLFAENVPLNHRHVSFKQPFTNHTSMDSIWTQFHN